MAELLDDLRAAVVDRYEVVSEIGQGGMGSVYLALERHPRRKVVIKVPELFFRPRVRQRFVREVTLAGMLNHPHIVPVLAAGEAGEFPYYVMPHFEGESLRQRLDRGPALTPAEVLHITRDVADALAYAHAKGIVHRDIKPANILLSEGHAVVTDFGIAQACHTCGVEEFGPAGSAIGTPAYMSPEQARGRGEVDARSDVYSLALVVYEMLAGALPRAHAAVSKRASQSTKINGRRTSERIPAAVAPVLAMALAEEPTERFPTAAAFGAALAVALPGQGSLARRPVAALWMILVATAAVAAALAFLLGR